MSEKNASNYLLAGVDDGYAETKVVHIAREFPPVQREIPDHAVTHEGASVVSDGALHGGVTIGAVVKGMGASQGGTIV